MADKLPIKLPMSILTTADKIRAIAREVAMRAPSYSKMIGIARKARPADQDAAEAEAADHRGSRGDE